MHFTQKAQGPPRKIEMTLVLIYFRNNRTETVQKLLLKYYAANSRFSINCYTKEVSTLCEVAEVNVLAEVAQLASVEIL